MIVSHPVRSAVVSLLVLAAAALPARPVFAQVQAPVQGEAQASPEAPVAPAGEGPLPELFVDETVREETQREVPTWDEDRPAALALPPAMDGGNLQRGTAVLRWLDKATARVRTIEVPVNQTTTIQTLEFIVRACLERPPEEPPENAAFLDIWERKPGEPVSEVFRGWMFASSPAVSAMEHPVYDLWVMACKDPSPEAAPASGSQ